MGGTIRDMAREPRAAGDPAWLAAVEDETLLDPSVEWLEADGLGGFASGTASGVRTRRYHGVLCAARTPPTGRLMLVSAVEAFVDVGGGPRALSAHRYEPGVTHPDGLARLASFAPEPFPTWTYALGPGVRVVHELLVARDSPCAVLRWRLEGVTRGARLTLRPLLAFRDVHALRRGDAVPMPEDHPTPDGVRWTLPGEREVAVLARSNAAYRAGPLRYAGFLYEEERERGYDHLEDLASPGWFEHDLADGDACLVLEAELGTGPGAEGGALTRAGALRARELERRSGLDPTGRAAECYVVRRGAGRSIVAGYPWFTDWGRDTFIAMRGLLLARGEVETALEILEAWSAHVSRGMLPNRFPDGSAEPEYNSVDASLWFVVALAETLERAAGLEAARRERLEAAALEIVEGYRQGTRYGIRADEDGLLACGGPGLQLTWMDAKVGDQVMTPRVGKPVEIQALWIHALAFAARRAGHLGEWLERARASFEPRFWNEASGHLHDVVDCDHVAGAVDTSLRPNQALAVGGLAEVLITPRRARRVVEALERWLWTPLGMRTLPTFDPRYRGHYEGDPLARDGAYHQGTAWAWMLGPFVQAWVRAQGDNDSAREAARTRFLAPLRAHLAHAGLGHVSEIADGDPPHHPRGCPFQAWSVGELIRLDREVLATGD